MAANSAARLPAMVDLPTPPFRPATAMIAIEVGITIIAYSGAGGGGGMQASVSELRSDAKAEPSSKIDPPRRGKRAGTLRRMRRNAPTCGRRSQPRKIDLLFTRTLDLADRNGVP